MSAPERPLTELQHELLTQASETVQLTAAAIAAQMRDVNLNSKEAVYWAAYNQTKMRLAATLTVIGDLLVAESADARMVGEIRGVLAMFGREQIGCRSAVEAIERIVVGANGAVQFTTPNTPGFTYNAYIGTTTSPFNLGVSVQGPTQGPLQGQATQLPPNTVCQITALGVAQVPPAAPATGVTVYPTFIFGRGAYAQVVLDNVKFTYLKEADKSDPLNQLRVVGWKNFYGTLIQNAQFMLRLESTSAFNATFG